MRFILKDDYSVNCQIDVESIKQDLTLFLSKLQFEFEPEFVLLFGSRALGDARKGYSYDFIIVSESFQGMRWRNRISQLVKIWNRNEKIHLVPYTNSEFNEKKRDSLEVRSAIQEAIQLLP